MSARERALLDAAAYLLASRMAHHAECDTHPASQPDQGCPYCMDRAAYAAWLAAGGQDYRPDYGGPGVTLGELIQRTRPPT